MSQEQWNSLERTCKRGIIDGTIIADIWHDEDVRSRAEDMGVDITEEQIKEVLSCVHRKADANIGINWDTIDYWIEEVISG